MTLILKHFSLVLFISFVFAAEQWLIADFGLYEPLTIQ